MRNSGQEFDIFVYSITELLNKPELVRDIQHLMYFRKYHFFTVLS